MFDLNEQIGKCYAVIHSIISNCGVNKELVILELLKRKCAPILFYALDAISINNKIRDVICKVWHVSTRLILKLTDVKVPGTHFIIVIYYQQVSK